MIGENKIGVDNYLCKAGALLTAIPKISELTNYTEHRPWLLPNGPWIMTQQWIDLLFAHWPIDAAEMAKLIPRQLTLDLYDGQAWVGLVPFRMANVRPRFCPAVPWLSAFPEFNVRTYVRANDSHDPAVSKPGVYFFSLDAGNPLAVTMARQWFKLPYFRAKMGLTYSGHENQPNQTQYSTVHYHTERTHSGATHATFAGSYGPTGDVYTAQPETLDKWLTERYSLYTVDPGGRVYRGEIHHKPWPLQPAHAEIDVNTMAKASGISLPDTPPLLHFAQHLDVVVWPLERVAT